MTQSLVYHELWHTTGFKFRAIGQTNGSMKSKCKMLRFCTNVVLQQAAQLFPSTHLTTQTWMALISCCRIFGNALTSYASACVVSLWQQEGWFYVSLAQTTLLLKNIKILQYRPTNAILVEFTPFNGGPFCPLQCCNSVLWHGTSMLQHSCWFLFHTYLPLHLKLVL